MLWDMENVNVRELAKKYGYKQEILKRYFEIFGERVEDFLKANEVEPKTSIRTNTLKISKDRLKERLEEKGCRVEEISDLGFFLKSKFSPASMQEYLLGYFYIQGVAEMHISPILKPKGIVWDMTASPGGKTTHIAQLMENKGVIVATDVNPEKIKALKSHIMRMGVKNCVVYKMSALDLTMKFEKILLDAPCTGSGIVRKDKTRKYSRKYKDIEFCSNLQKKLVGKAIENLEEGGELVYSTCSVEPEENEFVVEWALENFDVELEEVDFKILGKKLKQGFTNVFGRELNPEIKKCGRCFPHTHNTNGMFVARMKKVGDG